jgi:hypothetical protein
MNKSKHVHWYPKRRSRADHQKTSFWLVQLQEAHRIAKRYGLKLAVNK